LGVFLLNQIYKLETTFFFLVAEISTNFGASSPCAAGNATGIAQNDSEIPILREILQILPTILLFWANLLDFFSKKNYFP
ncbi:hypothetical protein, partial [Fibrobacter sp. UWP2]|uniref:hypothetical protein n=1 Tax=Fibrobacter sp. UWP2 TaxID=1896216 RepID=UPI00092472E2